jgi:hypothetical protein
MMFDRMTVKMKTMAGNEDLQFNPFKLNGNYMYQLLSQ